MSKTVDWNQMYKSPVKRGESFRDKYAEAVSREQGQSEAQRNWKALEEEVRKSLLDHMVNRKPIRVIRPFKIITDRLQKADLRSKFVEAYEEIMPGTELTFVTRNRTFGQWIFKSADGQEYEIYDRPTLVMNDRMVPNTGFWGLLTCTHLYDDVVNKGGNNEEE